MIYFAKVFKSWQKSISTPTFYGMCLICTVFSLLSSHAWTRTFVKFLLKVLKNKSSEIHFHNNLIQTDRNNLDLN